MNSALNIPLTTQTARIPAAARFGAGVAALAGARMGHVVSTGAAMRTVADASATGSDRGATFNVLAPSGAD